MAINVKMDVRLTQEFWNKLAEQHPEGVCDFRKWIDEYKRRVNWDDLFGNAGQTRVAYLSNIKVHHLPDAMQAGIFLQYVLETRESHRMDLVFDTDKMICEEYTYAAVIEEWFEHEKWAKEDDSPLLVNERRSAAPDEPDDKWKKQ